MHTQPHSAPACTSPAPDAPYTLRFTQWQCGHHGTRPDDIPCHSIEQAQAIVWAIGFAISQPGHARAVLFNADHGTSIYITDDYAEAIKPDEWHWAFRTTIYRATAQEWAELQGLRDAFDYAIGGELKQWDGTTLLEEPDVVTTLSLEKIEAAIEPVSWYENGQRRAVCDVPPIIKPAAELLAKLREAAQKMAQEQAQEGGAVQRLIQHLVPSQPLQTGAVGLPVGGAVGGNATIAVEIYALGVGVAIAREGRDLCCGQGTLELEAAGRRLVIDPLGSRKTQWLVQPVEGDVAAAGQALQAVDQDDLAQLGSGGLHGSPSGEKTAILSLPQGWGKSGLARPLADFIGCSSIVDEWRPSHPVVAGALHLTSECLEGGAA